MAGERAQPRKLRERNAWKRLASDEQKAADDTYAVWSALLEAREHAEEHLRDAYTLKCEAQEPDVQALAEVLASEARDRIAALDLAAFRAKGPTQRLKSDLKWIAARRRLVKAVEVTQGAIAYMRAKKKPRQRKEIQPDELGSTWRRECALVAMLDGPRKPSEKELDEAFARFKHAYRDPRVSRWLEDGMGTQKAALELVRLLHGVSQTTLERCLAAKRGR